MELVNSESECSIGILEKGNEDEIVIYLPLIMWNLQIKSYISEKDSSYRAYKCQVKISGKNVKVESFCVFIKDSDFSKFDKVRAAIVSQTHGHLIMNSRFDNNLWSDFVPKLIFESSDKIIYQRTAKNVGLQWHYLKSMAFDHGGALQLEHVEVVYRDVVYNGLGKKLETPVNVLVPEAYPNKTFRVTDFKPSGLRGFLQLCLPPYTSTSVFRREQQILVIMGALSKYKFSFHLDLTLEIFAKVPWL